MLYQDLIFEFLHLKTVTFISSPSHDQLELKDHCAADAIECKWNPEAFETRGLAAFREQYPKGKNYVASPLNGPSYERVQGGLKISIVSPGELRQAMA